MPEQGDPFGKKSITQGDTFSNDSTDEQQLFLESSGLRNSGIDSSTWYQTFPYRFVIMKDENGGQGPDNFYVYSLPIPPEQLVIKPVYASDTVATMGGVIEECSEVTFWQIIMSGLMPLSVNRSIGEDDSRPDYANPAKNFRDTMNTTGLLTGIASSLTGPLLSAGGTIASVTAAGNSGDPISALEAIVEPHLPYTESAVSEDNNGYSEIYAMQRFFQSYEHIKSRQNKSDNSTYTLFFENVKDNQRFRVIPKQTDFIRTSKTPYGYRYQIVLQGWKLDNVATSNIQNSAQDRFAHDLKSVSTLSFTELLNAVKRVSAAMSKISNGDLSTFAPTPPVL